LIACGEAYAVLTLADGDGGLARHIIDISRVI
jgi:hypothetical protein